MDIEKTIISYLCKYGNTKESDIISYGIKKFNYDTEQMKKILKCMMFEGKIHYVIHNELETPEIYVSLKEPLPPEVAKILIEAQIEAKTLVEESQKILEEAATLVEKRKKNTTYKFD